ncbi:MAG: hypothetical protein FD156_957 [Nitrospirae bacterium]|nr:MAG: hypothetical protein FD156_957 [Nitrospirota bacterium]
MINEKVKKIVVLFLILFLFACSAKRGINTSHVDASLTARKPKAEERLPTVGAIYLSDEFINKMPALLGDDKTLWPWFFKRAIEPVFNNVVIINGSDDIKNHPEVKLIVKPELWGFFFQSYYGTWTCWLDFKFRFMNRDGNEITGLFAEGKGIDGNIYRALGSSMSQVIEKLQKNVLYTKRNDIISGAGLQDVAYHLENTPQPAESKPFNEGKVSEGGIEFKTVAENLNSDSRSRQEIKEYGNLIKGKFVTWAGKVNSVKKGRRGSSILVYIPEVTSENSYNVILSFDSGEDDQIGEAKEGRGISFSGVISNYKPGKINSSAIITIKNVQVITVR